MTFGLRLGLIALLALAALLTLVAGATLLVPFALAALAAGGALVLIARWRPERVALILATLAVAAGTIAACAGVVDGVADSRVEFDGKVDAAEIRRAFQPAGGARKPSARARRGYGRLTDARGEATVPRAGAGVLALWAVWRLAPWLLAAVALALLAPILLAAGRGEPFWESAARRLSAIGVLLLAGIPAIALLGYAVAQVASDGSFQAPAVEPALDLSIVQLLPGALVLALAGVFRRGVELREFERHTI